MKADSLPQLRSFLCVNASRARAHTALLYMRAVQDLSDGNPTWLAAVICLMSLAMAWRMADVAGWVHSAPLVTVPVPGSHALISDGNEFWRGITDAKLGCCALLLGCALSIFSRLERWRLGMMGGLFILMAWWWVISVTMLFQLGLAVGAIYFVGAATSCVASYKTVRSFDVRDTREAEVDESVKLFASLRELYASGDLRD